MRLVVIACLFICVPSLFPAISVAGNAISDPYVEFLWSGQDGSHVARAEAYAFVKESDCDHQICLKWARDKEPEASNIRVDVVDAAEEVVASNVYSADGRLTACYPANIVEKSESGLWQFRVYVNDILRATKRIYVASTLRQAREMLTPHRPYVIGRPNYDKSIDPSDYSGHVTWEMTVDNTGSVIRAKVVDASGAGLEMSDRAIEAAYLYRFFPDSQRGEDGVTYRQRYELRPDVNN